MDAFDALHIHLLREPARRHLGRHRAWVEKRRFLERQVFLSLEQTVRSFDARIAELDAALDALKDDAA